MEALETLLLLFKTSYNERNKLAHWLGGICTEIQEGILLMDPIDAWRHRVIQQEQQESFHAELMQFSAEFRRTKMLPDKKPEMPWNPFPSNKILVFTADDFAAMNLRMSDIQKGFFLLRFVIGNPDAAHRAKLLGQLQQLPQYQQRNEQLHRMRQKTPRGALAKLFDRVCRFLSKLRR